MDLLERARGSFSQRRRSLDGSKDLEDLKQASKGCLIKTIRRLPVGTSCDENCLTDAAAEFVMDQSILWSLLDRCLNLSCSFNFQLQDNG